MRKDDSPPHLARDRAGQAEAREHSRTTPAPRATRGLGAPKERAVHAACHVLVSWAAATQPLPAEPQEVGGWGTVWQKEPPGCAGLRV